jgi:hypothetical protein
MTCGEETEYDCLKSIEPFRNEIQFQEVRNVYPQIKALNQMLDQVETDYLIPLDSDMVLFPDALERIQRAIDKYSHDLQWHSILFPLWDTLSEKKILALKILRTNIMKQYPFVESATPDIEHFECLTKAGFTCIQNYLARSPIGNHIVKGAWYCYQKYKDVYRTYRVRGWEWDPGIFLGGETIQEKSKAHFDFFLYKHIMTNNDDYLYCIAGMVDGLTCELENKSKTLEKSSYRIKKMYAIDEYWSWYRYHLNDLANSLD